MKISQKGSVIPIILVILAVIMISGGILGYKRMHEASMDAQNFPTSIAPNNETISQAPSGVTTGTMMKQESSLSKGNSNAELDQDLSTIDGKMNSVNDASSEVETSIQNQSIDTQNNTQ